MSHGLRRDEAWLKRHIAGKRGMVDARKHLEMSEPNLRVSRALETILTPGSSKYPVFEAALRAAGLGPFRTEYVFCDGRLWRFDYAWPHSLVCLEVEGGAFAKGGGGHNRGAGFVADMEKYNAAGLLGWRVFRYPPDKLATSIPDIERAIRGYSTTKG